MTKHDELAEKLKTLCEEYPDMDTFIIIRDGYHLTFCGTGCPVCVNEIMTLWIENEKIQHKYGNEDKVH